MTPHGLLQCPESGVPRVLAGEFDAGSPLLLGLEMLQVLQDLHVVLRPLREVDVFGEIPHRREGGGHDGLARGQALVGLGRRDGAGESVDLVRQYESVDTGESRRQPGMGHLSPVVEAGYFEETLLYAAADDTHFEARLRDSPQGMGVDAFQTHVAEKADGADLSAGTLQDLEPLIVYGRTAQEGVWPDASSLLKQECRGAGDEVGAQEQLALRLSDVLRSTGEMLVVVRAVVEHEPRVEARNQGQRRPRRRIGHDDRTGACYLAQVAEDAWHEELCVHPPECSVGRRGGERRVHDEVSPRRWLLSRAT